MSKSEQIGELSKLELSAVNEKLRTTQRLIDGLLETFGEDFLSQFMTVAEHDVLPHTLGEVVPHDELVNLLDVNIQNDTLQDNQEDVLRISEDGGFIENAQDPNIVDINNYIDGTANQVIVTDDGDKTATLSTPQDIHAGASPTFVTETLTGLTASQLVKTDAGKTLASTIGTVQNQICLDFADSEPARASETNWHGGLLALATAQPLDAVPTDLPVTKGIGKLMIVINAGSDLDGEITITGTTIDRNTGVATPADTDTITVDALTTDGTTVDSNGNTVHTFTGAYISSKWFTGAVVLSTTDLTLTDVDVYHVSFEQVNDSPNLVINGLDANIFTTNVNAEFDAYLYTLHVTGDKCRIDKEADIHVGADGETAIANRYFRLKRGNIDEALDGTTDGFWVDIHYSNSPAYVEDVTMSVWITETITVELS